MRRRHAITGRTCFEPSRSRGALVTAASLAALLLVNACRQELPQKPAPGAKAVAHAASAPAQGLEGRRVLLVHSYHPEYPWVDSITSGVTAAVKDTGITLDIFYMDTKRRTDEAWKLAAGREARARMETFRPDVILAVDDDAQQYFGKSFVNTSLPLVFSGVDADPSKYGYPAANVTGIIERPHLIASLALARRLCPLRRIAVLSGNDSTSVAALGFMKQEKLDVEVTEWTLAPDFNAWKEAVERCNRSADALVVRSYQAVKAPGGEGNVPPAEVAAWTVEHAAIPTIAFHDFEITDGILVGVVKSGEEYGGNAMEYAVKILQGTPPAALPVIRTKLGVPMINGDTARRLGIVLSAAATEGVTVVSRS